jgi:hypothetical protein
LIKSFIQKILQGLTKGTQLTLGILLDLYKTQPSANPSWDIRNCEISQKETPSAKRVSDSSNESNQTQKNTAVQLEKCLMLKAEYVYEILIIGN